MLTAFKIGLRKVSIIIPLLLAALVVLSPSQTTIPSAHALSTCVISQPQGVVFDPVNNNVYVADTGSNTVSVISSVTNAIIATVSVGNSPSIVAYDPANTEIYVSNTGSNTVSAISSVTNTVLATVSVGNGPFWLAFDPANNEMFVTNYNFPAFSNTVSAIDPTNTVVHTITVGNNPIRLAYSPSTTEMYVADYSSSQVSAIDRSNAVVSTINGLPGNPNTVGFDPANHDIYVSSNNSNSVTVISPLNTIITTIGVGGNPYGMFFDNNITNGFEMFVSATVGNAVYAISSTTNTVDPRTPITADNPNLPGPYTVTYSASNGNMYASDINDAAVTVISGRTDTKIATISVGSGPDISAFDPANSDLYVANGRSDSVSVISPNNNVVATINSSSCAPPPPPGLDSTSTTISCAPSIVAVDQVTQCTAFVTDTSVTPSSPTGTVTFSSSNTGMFNPAACTLNPISSSSSSCSVNYTPAPGTEGTQTIAGNYSGDTLHRSSPGYTTISVTKRSTSVNINCSPDTTQNSHPTTCTATVTDSSLGTTTSPTGTITWASNGPGTFTPTICTLTATGPSSANCTVTYTPKPGKPGLQTITGTYSGDTDHAGSSGSTTINVL